MSVPEQMQKIKGFFTFHEGKLGTILHILLLLGICSGGYLIGQESQNMSLEGDGRGVAVFSPTSLALPSTSESTGIATGTPEAETLLKKQGSGTGSFVASTKGTKYHRLDCPGAATIKDTNRVYFASEDEARNAGFSPAGNCPGLQN